MKKIAVAIDGPAGAGKSTIAKAIADRLGITYIDTGAMYRAITLNMIRNNVDINDLENISKLINTTDIAFKDGKVYLNGQDVSQDIRTQEVSNLCSPVSAIPLIREKLVELQRNMAHKSSVIMDGRDIGTNVLKDADVKIYLTASSDERARRRYIELKNKGYDVKFEDVKSDIEKRDRQDSSRKLNPLKPADDAFLVDTTQKTIEDVIEEILGIIKARCNDVI